MELKRYFLIFFVAAAAALVGVSPVWAQQAPASSGASGNAVDAEAAKSAESTEEGQGQAAGKPSQKEETPPDKTGATARYQKLIEQAAGAYRAAEYAEALKFFKKAYAVNAVPNLLYNMGRVEEKRGNFKAAIGYYDRFITQPGVTLEARQKALGRLKTLREVVAVSASEKPTKPADSEQVSPPVTPVPTPMPTPEPVVRIERDYTPVWISMGVALAAYATSGVFAWQARQAYQDFQGAASRDVLRDSASWGETASWVADSSLALGVVATGVGIYFLVSPIEYEVRGSTKTVEMGISPRLGTGGAGVTWSLVF